MLKRSLSLRFISTILAKTLKIAMTLAETEAYWKRSFASVHHGIVQDSWEMSGRNSRTWKLSFWRKKLSVVKACLWKPFSRKFCFNPGMRNWIIVTLVYFWIIRIPTNFSPFFGQPLILTNINQIKDTEKFPENSTTQR